MLTLALASAVAFPASAGAAKTYDTEVVLPDFLSTSPDYDQMRTDLVYADFFHHLGLLGTQLNGIYDTHTIAFDEINLDNTTSMQELAKTNIEREAKYRNELAKGLVYFKDAKANAILSNYSKAINKYKVANQYLLKFRQQPTQYNYNMFQKNNSEAMRLSLTYTNEANSRYSYYMEGTIDSLSDFLGYQ